MIKVFLKGPEATQEPVELDEDATVRDVAVERYSLFFRDILLNGEKVPYTAHIHDGDRVEVTVERV